MAKIPVKVWKLSSSINTPKYAHATDAGFDLASSVDIILQPNSLTIVPTGLIFEIPNGYEIQIRSRSGFACRGIVVNNAPGTIDSGYRGEIKLLINNQTNDQYPVTVGDRLAQGVIAESLQAEFVETDLPDNVVMSFESRMNNKKSGDRGTSGLGSTGVA